MKIRTISIVTAATILLVGCSKQSGSSGTTSTPASEQISTQSAATAANITLGDVQIRQRIVGSWTLDSDQTNSVTFKSDGSFSGTVDHGQGIWTVTNGVFIGIENGPDGDDETGKVVRIDDHEWILQEVGTGHVTKFHKQ